LTPGKKNIDIDELFRSKLHDYPIEPGDYVKGQLMRKVSSREFLRFNPGRFNIWYAAAGVISITAVLTFSVLNSKDKKSIQNLVIEDTSIVNEVIIQTSPDTVPPVSQNNDKLSDGKDKNIVATGEAITKKRRTRAEENTTDATAIRNGITPPANYNFNVNELNDKAMPVELPVSSFRASALAGCAPLKVSFANSTEYRKIKWISSDGRVSSADSLVWVFRTPGSYRVLMTVTDNDGREGHSAAEIIVYPNPVAKFDVSASGRAGAEKEIITYNYSEGAIASHWDFGDGTQSDVSEPGHIYKTSGEYRILLKVANGSGCIDTVSHLFRARSTNKIEFPNAFIPNQDGPTGGYYSSRSDDAAEVFHPECEGVVEYSLVIYSRTGLVVFESREINIGWDGYYKGKLSEPGVYVYRAKGRFSNGEQFSKSGDLTLLRFRF